MRKQSFAKNIGKREQKAKVDDRKFEQLKMLQVQRD
jgi:hypothetical protein